MPLATEIAAIRNRALNELIAEHDYFVDTLTAWGIVREGIESGRRFANRNRVTGTITTASQLAEKAKPYAAIRLAEATFQQFIAIFESFFLDLMRIWLLEYPQSLANRKIEFKAILDAPDKDAMIQHVIARELTEILYERPTGWFGYLEERAKLGCPTPDEIDQFAEAKASRDLLVHNRGIATRTYTSKAGRLARCAAGERIAISAKYHRETWELLRKVVRDVSDAAIAKLP